MKKLLQNNRGKFILIIIFLCLLYIFISYKQFVRTKALGCIHCDTYYYTDAFGIIAFSKDFESRHRVLFSLNCDPYLYSYNTKLYYVDDNELKYFDCNGKTNSVILEGLEYNALSINPKLSNNDELIINLYGGNDGWRFVTYNIISSTITSVVSADLSYYDYPAIESFKGIIDNELFDIINNSYDDTRVLYCNDSQILFRARRKNDSSFFCLVLYDNNEKQRSELFEGYPDSDNAIVFNDWMIVHCLSGSGGSVELFRLTKQNNCYQAEYIKQIQ